MEGLCDFCTRFTRWVAEPSSTSTREEEFFIQAVSCDMEVACCLCQKTFRALRDVILSNVDISVSATLSNSEMENEQALCCWGSITVTTDKYDPFNINFALWAEKGSPACERFVSRVPILSPRIDELSCLVNGWVNECRSFHDGCFIDDLDELTNLPSRILQLSGSPEAPLIRLIETKGLQGRYCALSYCWGPEENWPLRTTSHNIQQHLIDIPFQSLPRTFQDTAVLVRSMGIKFLWIDSFCIIQDSKSDWEAEASKMRDVYRNATLVIQAAGSGDSTGGLHVTDRPHIAVNRVPYVVNDIVKDSFNLATSMQDPFEFTREPLSTRAWAFQEQYLARGSLLCMSSGFSWHCKHQTLFERGDASHESHAANLSWLRILQIYTKKHLTYPSDRLVALQGIVTELQHEQKSQYYSEYGVWKDDIHEQILWGHVHPVSDTQDLPLPSWSWAATGGSKDWLALCPFERIECVADSIDISNVGTLSCVGSLIAGTRMIRCTARQHDDFEIRGPSYYELENMMLTLLNMNDQAPALLILDNRTGRRPYGLASFDRDRVVDVKFFLVGRSWRVPSDYNGLKSFESSIHDLEIPTLKNEPEMPFYADDALEVLDMGEESDTISREDDAEMDRSPSPVQLATDEDELRELNAIDAMPSHDGMTPEYWSQNAVVEVGKTILDLIRATDYVYWALMIEPVGEASYRRVGIAMLYPHALESESKISTKFEIV